MEDYIIRCKFTSIFKDLFLNSKSLMKDWLRQDTSLDENYKKKIECVHILETGKYMEIEFEPGTNCLIAMKQLSGSAYVRMSWKGWRYVELILTPSPAITFSCLSVRKRCEEFGKVLIVGRVNWSSESFDGSMRVILISRMHAEDFPKIIRVKENDPQTSGSLDARTVQLDLSECPDKMLHGYWEDIVYE